MRLRAPGLVSTGGDLRRYAEDGLSRSRGHCDSRSHSRQSGPQSSVVGRDVFVEKPFTLSVPDAEELADLADKTKRVLMVGHLLDTIPSCAAQAMIQSGELGEVDYIYTQRINLGRIRHDENALWSFAPHDISQILYMLEMSPTDVSVRGQSYSSPVSKMWDPVSSLKTASWRIFT